MISTDSYIRIMHDKEGCDSIVIESDENGHDNLKINHGGGPLSPNCPGDFKWYIQKY